MINHEIYYNNASGDGLMIIKNGIKNYQALKPNASSKICRLCQNHRSDIELIRNSLVKQKEELISSNLLIIFNQNNIFKYFQLFSITKQDHKLIFPCNCTIPVHIKCLLFLMLLQGIRCPKCYEFYLIRRKKRKSYCFTKFFHKKYIMTHLLYLFSIVGCFFVSIYCILLTNFHEKFQHVKEILSFICLAIIIMTTILYLRFIRNLVFSPLSQKLVVVDKNSVGEEILDSVNQFHELPPEINREPKITEKLVLKQAISSAVVFLGCLKANFNVCIFDLIEFRTEKEHRNALQQLLFNKMQIVYQEINERIMNKYNFSTSKLITVNNKNDNKIDCSIDRSNKDNNRRENNPLNNYIEKNLNESSRNLTPKQSDLNLINTDKQSYKIQINTVTEPKNFADKKEEIQKKYNLDFPKIEELDSFQYVSNDEVMTEMLKSKISHHKINSGTEGNFKSTSNSNDNSKIYIKNSNSNTNYININNINIINDPSNIIANISKGEKFLSFKPQISEEIIFNIEDKNIQQQPKTDITNDQMKFKDNLDISPISINNHSYLTLISNTIFVEKHNDGTNGANSNNKSPSRRFLSLGHSNFRKLQSFEKLNNILSGKKKKSEEINLDQNHKNNENSDIIRFKKCSSSNILNNNNLSNLKNHSDIPKVNTERKENNNYEKLITIHNIVVNTDLKKNILSPSEMDLNLLLYTDVVGARNSNESIKYNETDK